MLKLYSRHSFHASTLEKSKTAHLLTFNLCATTVLLFTKVHRAHQTYILRPQKTLTMMCLTRKLSLLTTSYTREPNNLHARYLLSIHLLKFLYHRPTKVC